ncbi:hypothetical protein IWZ03DRAFT_110688 [Phyllosticta citriasiana]|uniref:Uncharacterized protein n=1 Tax=Phyllosticta citriasiana TaxID=595635 RepID=A0ABR1KXF3_9PEZI
MGTRYSLVRMRNGICAKAADIRNTGPRDELFSRGSDKRMTAVALQKAGLGPAAHSEARPEMRDAGKHEVVAAAVGGEAFQMGLSQRQADGARSQSEVHVGAAYRWPCSNLRPPAKAGTRSTEKTCVPLTRVMIYCLPTPLCCSFSISRWTFDPTVGVEHSHSSPTLQPALRVGERRRASGNLAHVHNIYQLACACQPRFRAHTAVLAHRRWMARQSAGEPSMARCL